ncbi:MAG: type II toxin-antitoxin system Phd/YefM family antitoxin [Planctomycetes bacterium]|jgi:antitoxin (DNA-binding transcriptional repressor) of toxin-antitoxin stability system|nr:type II toxin-antitoxin system Phd/YefM family antitoxin [Planctomycetota bacterium]
MRQVSVTTLKSELSRYLRLVKQGETIEVLEHRIPIARLEGIPPGGAADEDELRRLVRVGLVRAARRAPDLALLDRPPIPCSSDPARAVVDSRGDR